MAYQRKLKPLTKDEVGRIIEACSTFEERLVFYALLDGFSPSEIAGLKKDDIRGGQLIVWEKNRRHEKIGRRISMADIADKVRRLIEYRFAEYDDMGMSERTIQRIVKKVANRAGVNNPVSPQVLKHTASAGQSKTGSSLKFGI